MRTAPRVPQHGQLVVTTDHRRSERPTRRSALLAHEGEGVHRLRDALHRLRRRGDDLESIGNQPPHRLGHHDRPRIRERGGTGREVRGQAVDVVLVQVDEDETAMDPDPDGDCLAHRALRLAREPFHLRGQLGRRRHRPERVVLVGVRIAEQREEAIAFDADDVPLVAILDRAPGHDLVAVHERPVPLGLEPLRQLGRADEVAAQDRESPQLAVRGVLGREQLARFLVRRVVVEHALGEVVRGREITRVDRVDRLVQQRADPGRVGGHAVRYLTSTVTSIVASAGCEAAACSSTLPR